MSKRIQAMHHMDRV